MGAGAGVGAGDGFGVGDGAGVVLVVVVLWLSGVGDGVGGVTVVVVVLSGTGVTVVEVVVVVVEVVVELVVVLSEAFVVVVISVVEVVVVLASGTCVDESGTGVDESGTTGNASEALCCPLVWTIKHETAITANASTTFRNCDGDISQNRLYLLNSYCRLLIDRREAKSIDRIGGSWCWALKSGQQCKETRMAGSIPKLHTIMLHRTWTGR